jgi:phage terminase large subunit-like protein
MALIEDKKILYSSHLVSASKEFFDKVVYEFFIQSAFYKRIGRKSIATGSQFIELKTGGQFKVLSRSRSSGKGGTYDLLIFDEHQTIDNASYAASQYTLATRKEAKQVFTGTPPTVHDDGAFIRQMRDKYVNTSNWSEYGVQDPNADIFNQENWEKANPSIDVLIQRDNIYNEITADTLDFRIQRLGLWTNEQLKAVVTNEQWSGCETHDKQEFSQYSLGISINQTANNLSVVACTKIGEFYYIQAVDQQRLDNGTKWLIDFIKSRNNISNILIDGIGGELIFNELKGHYQRIAKLAKTYNAVSANSQLLNLITRRAVRHFDQPALTQAITKCEKRPIGKAGGFGFDPLYEDIKIDLVSAAALAIYAYRDKRADQIMTN